MTVLSDGGILQRLEVGDLKVVPFRENLLGPASLDFCLGDEMLIFNRYAVGVVDPYDLPENLHTRVQFSETKPFILHPGDFALGSTSEVITIPGDMVARVEGKSSLGRLGLILHTTAGYVDSGFTGQVTLEFANLSTFPIKLVPGMRIGQFAFETLDAYALRPYGHPSLNSKYVGQRGPVGSRYNSNERPEMSAQ